MNKPSTHKTRLCLATPLFFPTYGGAQLRYMRYLPGLRDQGLDVRVFTGTATPTDSTPAEVLAEWSRYRRGSFLPVDEIEGTPVHRVRLPDDKGMLHRWMFYNSLWKHCRQPEFRPNALQLLGTIRVGSLPWILQLKRLGIGTLYSVTTASKVTRKKAGFDRRLFKFRTIFNAMDCVVTNNQFLKSALETMGVTTRVEAIPNGVDLRRFNPDGQPERAAAIRRELGIGDKDILIIAVGAIMARKGSDILVQAFSRLHRSHGNVHLLFLGPRQPGGEAHHQVFQDKVDRLVAESGAPEKIHFVDVTNDVPDYLRAADICALPSKREGLPNSVIEAMACGVPVMMTPFEGLADDLGQAEQEFLLAEHNDESVATQLGRLVESAELRQGLADRARDWIVRRMSLDDSVARYAALYEEMGQLRRRA